MRIDQASAVTLRAVIENDLQAIMRIEGVLAELLPGTPDEHHKIAAAYHLHNLYNALENTFDQISRSFENQVKNLSRWHHELLNKMFLDLSPLRPALLPERSRQALHDLRSFRHFFRHSYGCSLELAKLRDLWQRWQVEGPHVTASLKAFADALPAGAAQ